MAGTFVSLMQLFSFSRFVSSNHSGAYLSSQWCWRCLWPAVSWDSRGRGGGEQQGEGGEFKWPIESPDQVGALVEKLFNDVDKEEAREEKNENPLIFPLFVEGCKQRAKLGAL